MHYLRVNHGIAALLTLCFMFPAFAAGTTCFDCHGRKGMKEYVDRSVFEQSVHGRLACAKCHLGISEYPHGKVAKVNCGICHFTGNAGAPREQAQQYKLSVHGKEAAVGNGAAPTCRTCHGSHAVFPSADTRSATHRKKIPALCSQCHPAEYEAYRTSIHATALQLDLTLKAPTCFDCHLEHLAPPTVTDRWKLALIRQCGNCHQEQMKTYNKTYHGKVTELGYATMAKCADCHGSHAIMTVTDRTSPIAWNNIIDTCRKCHAKATRSFTKFYAHAEEGNREKYPVLYYTYLFMTTLLIGVFSFFFLHTFLWAYRALKERMAKKGGA